MTMNPSYLTVKIDVEGSELQVLTGAKALLPRNRPLIMFETGTPQHTDLPKQIWNFLTCTAGRGCLPG